MIRFYFILSSALLFCLSFHNTAVAKRNPRFNNVRGAVFGTWKKADSPIIVRGNITIPSGRTLTIEAGVTVRVGGDYTTINVFGQLIAKGTPTDLIYFKSYKKNPDKWDWDRINFRSRQRSFLDYVTIKHSNYAAFCVNSAVSLDHCTFTDNSIHAIYAENATVDVNNCMINPGHVLAVSSNKGSEIVLINSTVKGNINGVACNKNSSLRIEKSLLTENHKAVLLYSEAALTLKEAKITKNRTGIFADKLPAVKKFPGVKDNVLNTKIDQENELEKIFVRPAEVKTITVKKTQKEKLKTFSGGLAIQKKERKKLLDVIGNVTLGIKYTKVDDAEIPENIGIKNSLFPSASSHINRKVREGKLSEITDTIPSTIMPGLQPEFKVFMTGKEGPVDINFLADMYYNGWDGVEANAFKLSLNAYQKHDINIGEFFEDNSELSVSNRKVRGIRYFSEFGKVPKQAEKLFGLTAIIGQSERPLGIGEHKLNAFLDAVDSNLGTYQQLFGMGKLAIRPMENASVDVVVLGSQDVYQNPDLDGLPLIKDIKTKGSVDPIENKTVDISGSYGLLDGAVLLKVEYSGGLTDTNWLDPSGHKKDGFFDKFGEFSGFAFGFDSKYKGIVADGEFQSTGKQFFTGGNPYLTKDMFKTTLNANGLITKILEFRASHEWRQEDKSFDLDVVAVTPKNINTVTTAFTLNMKKPIPEIQISNSFYRDFNEEWDADSLFKLQGTSFISLDSLDTAVVKRSKIKDKISLSIKQRFLKHSVKIKGSFQWQGDQSTYIDIRDNNKKDETRIAISTDLNMRFKKVRLKLGGKFRIKNKPNDKDQRDTQWQGSGKVTYDIIKRKLKTNVFFKYRLKNNYDYFSNEFSGRDTSGVKNPQTLAKITFINAGADLKYTISSKLSLTVGIAIDQTKKPFPDSAGFVAEDEPYLFPSDEIRESYRNFIGSASITYAF